MKSTTDNETRTNLKGHPVIVTERKYKSNGTNSMKNVCNTGKKVRNFPAKI